MIEELKNIKNEKSDFRKFGITVGIILIMVSGLLIWKEIESFQIFLTIGVVLNVLGIVIPVFLKPIYWIWMIFAAILGWIMTRVILSLLFYFDQKKNNEIISEIKKKYLLNDITVLNSLDEIKRNNFHFINLGSVIQYVKDYKFILNSLIDTAPEYIFFTAQTFYEKKVNKEENIIVKQINILPQINYCYFFYH
mgnify:CR=1 FL=1